MNKKLINNNKKHSFEYYIFDKKKIKKKLFFYFMSDPQHCLGLNNISFSINYVLRVNDKIYTYALKI